jgi:FG-GAP repeat
MKRSTALTVCLLAAWEAASAADLKMPTLFARSDYAGLDSTSIQAGDTNGDGFPDLIVNLSGGSSVFQTFFGSSNGIFQPGPTTRTILSYAQLFVASNLNGDSNVDLVVAGNLENGTGGILVCLGNGNGTIQRESFTKLPQISLTQSLWATSTATIFPTI